MKILSDIPVQFAVAVVVTAMGFQLYALEPSRDSPIDRDVHDPTAVLSSNASVHEKAMACRALSVMGDHRAVAALSPLLEDQRLAAYARNALEVIPGPAADEALRDSTERLRGELLAGVLHSIGQRRDVLAIDLLSRFIRDKDTQVACASARALGRIGGSQAPPRLTEALRETSGHVQAEVAWAILDCGTAFDQQGDTKSAISLYQDVRETPNLAKCIKLAAAERLAGALGEEGLPILTELLRSDEEQEFRTALATVRVLGAVSTTELSRTFDRLSYDRQMLVILALRDIRSQGALPTLLNAANSNDPRIRRVAVEALGQYDSPAITPKLLNSLSDQDSLVAAAAMDAVVSRPGSDIDTAVVAALSEITSPATPMMIELARKRRIGAATKPLLALLDRSSPKIRSSAISALGSTVGLADLPRLIGFAFDAKSNQREIAMKSLTVACRRLPQEACARLLLETLHEQPFSTQVGLIEPFTELGNNAALEIITKWARSDEGAQIDAATRLLGKWPTGDAASVLYELAGKLQNSRYRIRALRGYIRVARLLDLPNNERVRISENALQLADRVEEKELVLGVLRRYPTVDGLLLAGPLLLHPQLNDAAFETLVEMVPTTAEESPTKTYEALYRISKFIAKDQRAPFDDLLSISWDQVRKAEEQAGFIPLFDGTTLHGWQGNREVFRVEEQQIVGGSLRQRIPRNEFLCSTKTYDDFELRLQFKVLGPTPNAGVQVRSHRSSGDHEVSGYQADLGPGWWGCLWDESRRKRVLAGPPEISRTDPVAVEDWNEYRIRCDGRRIRLSINGVQTADYSESDPGIPLTGIIALQVHAGEPMEARYRRVRIKELYPVAVSAVSHDDDGR